MYQIYFKLKIYDFRNITTLLLNLKFFKMAD